jgi:hypothetical protein
MKIRENKYWRSRQCHNCDENIYYAWLSGMSGSYIFLYSSDSSEILVSEILFDFFNKENNKESNFKGILNEYLRDKNLVSKEFDLKNNLVCPYCGVDLTNLTNLSFKERNQKKAIYIKNMIFRTDKDAFKCN